MIRISKDEKDYLEKNGCLWEEDLHRTNSNKKTYYATENNKVKTLLAKMKRDKISK